MSDITRDGLTADTVEAMALEWIAENPDKALLALLTEGCQTCRESGVYWNPVAGPGPGEPLPCPDCGGRGWLLKDEDLRWVIYRLADILEDDSLAVWLEADHE